MAGPLLALHVILSDDYALYLRNAASRRNLAGRPWVERGRARETKKEPKSD